MSIHDDGRNALEAFLALPWSSVDRLVPGPRAGRSAKVVPDCTIIFGTHPLTVPVEIKKTTTSVAQLRPLEYRTTIVWRAPESWWVVPPHDVVTLALDYVGQHCISSLECFNSGPPNDRWARWLAAPNQVPQRVRDAFLSGEQSSLKTLVAQLRCEIEALWSQQKALVREQLPRA